MLKRILITAALVALVQFHAHAGGFFFNAPIPVGLPADAVDVADFNGDGRDDLAALVGGHLEVHLQDANGVLGAPLKLAIAATTFLTVKSADLGANGTTEILIGYDAGLAVYIWDGASGFTLETHPAQSPCLYMATADLDLDGRPDVLCHGQLGDASVYYSDVGNALQSPVYMLTAAYDSSLRGVVQVQLKDVTGDGKPDLLIASSTINSFFVYPHDAGRGFLHGVAYPYPDQNDLYSGTIEAMDVDGDGANEVIVAKACNRPCSSLLIYRRGSGGYLTLSKRVATYDIPWALLAADVDRDGRQDLLVGHHGWAAVGRYMGQGQQLSDVEALTQNIATIAGSNRYAVGDLNHDGFTDLAVANTFGASILYGRQRAVSDFNGDGISDVWWRQSTGQNLVWRAADATKSTGIEAVDPAWSIEATGDFDGYGSAQVFWRNRTTGANRIRYSADYTADITAVASQDLQVVGAGDFNGDDHADLLWRNARTGANTIWRSGNSSTWQAVTSVTDLHWKIAGVGDFNGDGRSDILWRNTSTGADTIWRSAQSGAPQTMSPITIDWQVAGVGDFNGDKTDDVLWHNTSSGLNTIWLSAKSTTQLGVTRVADTAWAITAVGDYNGDGRSDILWRNTSTGANVIWHSANAQLKQGMTTVSDLRWTIAP